MYTGFFRKHERNHEKLAMKKLCRIISRPRKRFERKQDKQLIIFR